MKGITGILAVVSALGLGLLILSSCGDNETGPEHDEITRNSPQNLLKIYAKALEDKSLADYRECLAPGYTFWFAEQDYQAAGVDASNPFWGLTEDVEAVSQMFESTNVKGIHCDLTIDGDVDCGDVSCTFVSDIDLLITVDEQESEPTAYRVDRSLLHFTLSVDQFDPSLWVIREIREEIIPDLGDAPSALAPLATEPSSYGHVKTMFTAIRRDSPENLVAAYAKALEQKSLPYYTQCLDDDYRFTFLEQDYTDAGVDSMAPYWDRTRDLSSTSAMFASSYVFDITCDLPILSDLSPSDTLRGLITDIDLKMTIDRGESELTTYWVNRSFLVFALARDRYQPSLWVIRGVEEVHQYTQETSGAHARYITEEADTYGNLKSMWR